jgi:hypothetical protein
MVNRAVSDTRLLYSMRHRYISHQACPTGIHFVWTEGSHEILTALKAMVSDVTLKVSRKSTFTRNVCNTIRLAASIVQACRDGAIDIVVIRLGDQ